MHTSLSRAAIAAGLVIVAAATAVAWAPTASAHAIVELNGDPAYAGYTSVLTLEVQHGCLTNEVGIDTVVVYFDSSYRSARPNSVSGWKSQRSTGSDGTIKITWTLTGKRPHFNTPTYFPMTVGWPSKAGVYGMPVKQKCRGDVNVWDEPDGPATANRPSPSLYPLPQIKVLAKP